MRKRNLAAVRCPSRFVLNSVQLFQDWVASTGNAEPLGYGHALSSIGNTTWDRLPCEKGASFDYSCPEGHHKKDLLQSRPDQTSNTLPEDPMADLLACKGLPVCQSSTVATGSIHQQFPLKDPIFAFNKEQHPLFLSVYHFSPSRDDRHLFLRQDILNNS